MRQPPSPPTGQGLDTTGPAAVTASRPHTLIRKLMEGDVSEMRRGRACRKRLPPRMRTGCPWSMGGEGGGRYCEGGEGGGGEGGGGGGLVLSECIFKTS